MTYAEKLSDPRWQRCRLEVMQRDNFTCVRCRRNTQTLTVHHSYYVKDRNPWDYPRFSLLTMCQTCHGKTHEHPEFWTQLEINIETAIREEVTFADLCDLTSALRSALESKASAQDVCKLILAIYPPSANEPEEESCPSDF